MTPMAYLKDHFEILKSIIGKNPVELNKSSPKTHYHCYETIESKGVHSDFIRIYQISKTQSFAFAFNGLEGKEGTITALWKIEGNSNTSDVYKEKIFKFEEFKSKLKMFNQTLSILKKSKALNIETQKETFSTVFDIANSMKDKEILLKECLTEIKIDVKPLKNKYNTNKRKLEAKSLEHIQIANEKDSKLKKLNIEYNIYALEEELKSLKNKIKDKLKKDTEKLQKVSSEKSRLETNLYSVKRELNYEVEELVKKYPHNFRQQLKEKLIVK